MSKDVGENAPFLETKNIYKWFGSVCALRDVNFKVYPRECVGLVGDNGAGKSTLIKILAGVLKPDRGESYIDGKRVKISSPRKARELGIETVFQDQALVECRNVWQNIFLGREIIKFKPLKVLDIDKMRNITENLMKELGLNIPSPDQEVRFCSGGERQGVAIARSMYFKARLVMLDEPTRALSVKGVEQVLNFVKRLKQSGISSIFVSHNVRHVYSVADRIVLMSRGRIVEEFVKEKFTPEEVEEILLKT